MSGLALLHIIVLLVHLVLAIVCLIDLRVRVLRTHPVQEVARAIWAVFVVVVPILGSAAYLIVRPGQGEDGEAP